MFGIQVLSKRLPQSIEAIRYSYTTERFLTGDY